MCESERKSVVETGKHSQVFTSEEFPVWWDAYRYNGGKGGLSVLVCFKADMKVTEAEACNS